jgi:NADP-dependent alcohol dehydrogenase
MALNGLIQKGVPTDWSTHMIGHELTAMYEIDHARTLAIIFPHLYKVKFENKKEKLAQYGSRIFGITGNIDDVAKMAIEKTVAFIHAIGMDTQLSQYTSDYEKAPAAIRKTFEARNWVALGERKDITPEDVEKIVKMSF